MELQKKTKMIKKNENDTERPMTNDLVLKTIVQRIQELNVMYLMLASEAARTIPIETSWLFGTESEQVSTLASLSLLDIEEMGKCGRVLFTLPIQIDSGDNSSLNNFAEITVLCDRAAQ